MITGSEVERVRESGKKGGKRREKRRGEEGRKVVGWSEKQIKNKESTGISKP